MPEIIELRVGKRQKKKQFVLYTKEEADTDGIEYLPWKQITDEGQYGLTDDDMVVPAVRVWGPYKGKKGYADFRIIRFPHGRYSTAQKSSRTTDVHPKPDNGKKEAQRRNTKTVVKMYAKLLYEQDGEVTAEQFEKLATLFRKDQRNPSKTFRRALKMDYIQKMVSEELRKLLFSQGITEESVLKDYEMIRERALEVANDDPDKILPALNLLKGVLDRYAKMMDMSPDKKRLVAQADFDFDSFALPEPKKELNGQTG